MWCSPRYPSEFSQETPDDKTRQQGNDGTAEAGGRAEECSDHHKDDRRRVVLLPLSMMNRPDRLVMPDASTPAATTNRLEMTITAGMRFQLNSVKATIMANRIVT